MMFNTRTVTIAAGDELGYVESDWCDELVIVQEGEIELEACSGSRWRFRCGDILWLVGLPLIALHNRGPEGAVLLAVSRERRMVTP